jgi:hypothetical protein
MLSENEGQVTSMGYYESKAAMMADMGRFFEKVPEFDQEQERRLIAEISIHFGFSEKVIREAINHFITTGRAARKVDTNDGKETA